MKDIYFILRALYETYCNVPQQSLFKQFLEIFISNLETVIIVLSEAQIALFERNIQSYYDMMIMAALFKVTNIEVYGCILQFSYLA